MSLDHIGIHVKQYLQTLKKPKSSNRAIYHKVNINLFLPTFTIHQAAESLDSPLAEPTQQPHNDSQPTPGHYRILTFF